MGARETLSRLTEAGFTLRLNDAGDKVRIGPQPVPEKLVALVRADKDELILLLRSGSIETGSPTSGGRSPFPCDPESGAPFSPWILPITVDEFHRRRNELLGMIEDLAAIEVWPREELDDVLSRAIRGPVGDLMPNLHYFRERLSDAKRSRRVLPTGGSPRGRQP